jgi:hypothetical protein
MLHVRFGQQAIVVGEGGIENDFFSCGTEGTLPGVVYGCMPAEEETSETGNDHAVVKKEYTFDM